MLLGDSAAGDLNEAARSVSCAFLRRLCEERLPGHMVPARVVDIDEMPLTSSGKVGRSGFEQAFSL